MSILVNRSPLLDFHAGCGQEHGDLISPFSFLLVAEGLAGLVHDVVHMGEFCGFEVNEEILNFTIYG